MITDVGIRQQFFEPIQTRAIEAVEEVEAGRTATHLKLQPILRALEKASAVGLDEQGILRYEQGQRTNNDPLVLCGLPSESRLPDLTFRTAEWRHVDPIKTPVMSFLGRSAAKGLVVEDELSNKNPVLHSLTLQSRLAFVQVPRIIGLPYTMGECLPHEVVHWVDLSKARLRFAPKKTWADERMIACAATEKRAYGLDAGMLALRGVDVELLSDKVIIDSKAKSDEDIGTISQRCFDVAYESVDKPYASSAYLCVEARTLTKLFGRDQGTPTLSEAKAYNEAEILVGH